LIRPDGHIAWVGDGTDLGLHDELAPGSDRRLAEAAKRRSNVGYEHVAHRIKRDLRREPLRLGIRADEDEKPAVLEAGPLPYRVVDDPDRLERGIAVCAP
jgi:hypothetical protein